jgi:hypothetical protein
MTTGFHCIQLFSTGRSFVQRLCFAERRKTIVRRVEKDDRRLIEFRQILMCVENLFAWPSMSEVNNRVAWFPRELAVRGQAYGNDPANRNSELRLRRYEHTVTSTQ